MTRVIAISLANKLRRDASILQRDGERLRLRAEAIEREHGIPAPCQRCGRRDCTSDH